MGLSGLFSPVGAFGSEPSHQPWNPLNSRASGSWPLPVSLRPGRAHQGNV